LKSYATDALNWGKGLGETLSRAFAGAESAFRSFVETGTRIARAARHRFTLSAREAI
jgi:hypothetical protein